MKVCIVGAGYVGLVTGACFAEFGDDVTCIDLDREKIDGLLRGELPIYEPGLGELVNRNMKEGRLRFSTALSEGMQSAQVVFIAVGTPSRNGDGHADLSYVQAAARNLAPYLRSYTVVVNKSTVPVGTARQVQRIIAETNPAADFDVASNPEFLREGAAIADFMRPDRIVLGVSSARAEATLRQLYRPLNRIETPILVTDPESAELIKYASNAFLATKISFINEVSALCEVLGADVHAVAKGMGLDGRIGRKFLHAGPGFGGSCFPKDTKALVRIGQEHGVTLRVVESVIEVNSAQRARMITKIRRALQGGEAGKTLAVLGLTFKPETDDMRDSPALSIIPALVEGGARIRAHDPKGIEHACRMLGTTIEYCQDIYDTFEDADAAILMTEWNVYRGLDLARIRHLMRGRVFVDLRNAYDPATMREAGFSYTGVGRPLAGQPRESTSGSIELSRNLVRGIDVAV